MLILVYVAIYAMLIQNLTANANPIRAILGTVGYTILLCFLFYNTGSIAQWIFPLISSWTGGSVYVKKIRAAGMHLWE